MKREIDVVLRVEIDDRGKTVPNDIAIEARNVLVDAYAKRSAEETDVVGIKAVAASWVR